jgi:hypothetical protein
MYCIYLLLILSCLAEVRAVFLVPIIKFMSFFNYVKFLSTSVIVFYNVVNNACDKNVCKHSWKCSAS